jgi:uncharacterized integral membrane protein
MKFLGKIIFLPIAIAVVLFAIANRHEVGIEFWPLPFAVETPLYVAMLGALALGILIGAAASAVSVGKWRFRALANARQIARSTAKPEIIPAATSKDIVVEAEPTLSHRPSTLPVMRRAALDDD